MSKSELNRQISTHPKLVAAISTAVTLMVILLVFWLMPYWAAWAFVIAYIYTDQYLSVKRLGSNPIP